MNIKQIIREEMDGFQWIRDIDPHEELYEPWVRRAIELMEDTVYYFDTDIGRQLGLLKRHTRSKKIIEDAIRVIYGRITIERIGEYASFRGSYEQFKEEDKKFLEGYELLKKSIQPEIYKRALKNLNEQDDFDWIRNEEVYYPINNINELKIGQKYYIDYRVGYDNEQLNLPVVFRSYPTRGASSYQFVGEGKDGELRNYLFFRHSTGEGLQDMIDKGKVKYKKSELKEQDDFEWVREMEPYNIHEGPWIIIYDNDEEFVEVQEWLFTQGYRWVNYQSTKTMIPQSPDGKPGFLFSGWVNGGNPLYDRYPHSDKVFDGYGINRYGGNRGMSMLDRFIKTSGDRVIYKWSKDIKPYTVI
jgi:hypothetical protein